MAHGSPSRQTHFPILFRASSSAEDVRSLPVAAETAAWSGAVPVERQLEAGEGGREPSVEPAEMLEAADEKFAVRPGRMPRVVVRQVGEPARHRGERPAVLQQVREVGAAEFGAGPEHEQQRLLSPTADVEEVDAVSQRPPATSEEKRLVGRTGASDRRSLQHGAQTVQPPGNHAALLL